MRKGFLLVVSGPSGVGKGTVTEALLESNDDLVFSISATTRGMRDYENDGEDYFFLTKEEFKGRVDKGEFLEYAEVHENMYGTPKDFVLEGIDKGDIIVLEIDVQGALQVKANYPNGVFVFLLPPSLEELEHRLTHRGTESEEQIAIRLANAKSEIAKFNEYQYAVINDEVDNAVKDINSIIEAEKLRVMSNDSLDKYLIKEGDKDD